MEEDRHVNGGKRFVGPGARRGLGYLALSLLVGAVVTSGLAACLFSQFWWASGRETRDLPLLAALLAAPLTALLALLGQWQTHSGSIGPGALGPGRSIRLFFAVTAGAWALHLLVGQPHGPATLVVTSGLAAGVFGLVHEITRRRWLGSAGRLWRGIELAVFQLCLTLVLFELALRLIADTQSVEILARSSDSVEDRIERHRLRPGTVRWGFPVNRQGHYDSELEPSRPDRPVVVSIGDSFGAGVVPHAFHFTTVAETHLVGIEIANLGVPAIGPEEYLHLLRTEGLALEPAAIVVNLYLGNDFFAAPSPQSAPASGPSLPLRAVRALAEAAAPWFDRERVSWPETLRRLGRVAAGVQTRSDAALGGTESDSRVLEDRYPWLADPHLERPTFRRRIFLELELERVRRLAAQRPSDLDPTLGVLRAIRDISEDRPLLLVLIPFEAEVEDELWREIQGLSDGPLPRYRLRRQLLPRLEQEGFRTLDLLPILRAQPVDADGSRHLYHLRDTHFNARGNLVAGEALAAALSPLLADTTQP